MNLETHYRSLTSELEARKNRVRNFISDGHWVTDGEWKETVLRSMIAQRLPDTVKIGRGFILTRQGPSTQCDILLYRSDCPVLFKEGDLVFLTPDSVLAVIEVKSKLTKTELGRAAIKLANIGDLLAEHSVNCCLSLFSYETHNENCFDWVTDIFPDICSSESRKIDLVSLGCSNFVKWWDFNPTNGDRDMTYRRWHSYNIQDISAGYFIANIIDWVSKGKVSENDFLWFSTNGKEPHLKETAIANFIE